MKYIHAENYYMFIIALCQILKYQNGYANVLGFVIFVLFLNRLFWWQRNSFTRFHVVCLIRTFVPFFGIFDVFIKHKELLRILGTISQIFIMINQINMTSVPEQIKKKIYLVFKLYLLVLMLYLYSIEELIASVEAVLITNLVMDYLKDF